MKKFTYKLKALWNILKAPASWYCTFSKQDAPFVEADMLHSVILTAARKLVEAEVINETRLNMIQDIIEDRSVVLHTVALSATCRLPPFSTASSTYLVHEVFIIMHAAIIAKVVANKNFFVLISQKFKNFNYNFVAAEKISIFSLLL